MNRFKNRAAVGLLVLGSLIPLTFAGSIVAAGPPAVGLGTADSYAVLAGDTITNTGATTINGDLGLYPGTSVTGSPTVNGASNVNNSAAQIAKTDLRTAYLNAEGRSGPILVAAGALGGRTLAPGLYKDDGAPASLGIASGQTLTLDGDASSVWIFQSASTLITETGSRVVLTGGAQACNVFWQVGSSATLKTGTVFVGTVMAHTSIAAQNSVTVAGRLLAGAAANGAGALTLDTDTITKTACVTATPPPPPPPPLPPTVGLGTADSYGVLAGDTITNTGATTINGDLGLYPGTSVTGSPTVNGASNVNNSAAQIAKTDLRTAYLNAEGRSGPILVAAGALGGRTLAPGLYKDDGAPASLGIAAGETLTLQGDDSSVWIFQSASTLITETGSRVVLSGGAQACNVFWQVGSSATLKTGTTFVGTVMAHTSIAAQNSVTVAGRLLAGAQANGAGALTMDTDTITRTPCVTAA